MVLWQHNVTDANKTQEEETEAEDDCSPTGFIHCAELNKSQHFLCIERTYMKLILIFSNSRVKWPIRELPKMFENSFKGSKWLHQYVSHL